MRKVTLQVLNKKLDKILALLKESALVVAPPEEKPGYLRLDMKSHMTAEWLVAECRKKFEVWVWDESWLKDVTSDRKGDYTVYFKDVQEADEENKDKSANYLRDQGNPGITLEERLMLELVYFEKYGKHLDIDNVTLCSASRDDDGSVPYVRYDPDSRKVQVYYFYPGSHDHSWRARSAVLK